MVQDQHQHVVIGADLKQRRAQREVAGQVERPGGELGHDLVQGLSADGDDGQRHLGRPAGRITWYGMPSAIWNTVRNTSCRPTTSVSACSSAPASRTPRSRTAIGTL